MSRSKIKRKTRNKKTSQKFDLQNTELIEGIGWYNSDQFEQGKELVTPVKVKEDFNFYSEIKKDHKIEASLFYKETIVIVVILILIYLRALFI